MYRMVNILLAKFSIMGTKNQDTLLPISRKHKNNQTELDPRQSVSVSYLFYHYIFLLLSSDDSVTSPPIKTGNGIEDKSFPHHNNICSSKYINDCNGIHEKIRCLPRNFYTQRPLTSDKCCPVFIKIKMTPNGNIGFICIPETAVPFTEVIQYLQLNVTIFQHAI